MYHVSCVTFIAGSYLILTESSLNLDIKKLGWSGQFAITVTLDSNIECTGRECDADELRVVQVGNVFYEYVRPACVEQVFYNEAKKLTYRNTNQLASCANPKLAYASEACQTDRKPYTKIAVRYSNYIFDQERVLYSTGQDRCLEDGWEQTWFHYINDIDEEFKGNFWTHHPCEIKVKVNHAGLVSIVYDADDSVHTNVAMDNRNYFKVYWDGDFPRNDLDGIDGNSCGNGDCSPIADGGCLCNITVTEEAVFSDIPASPDDVLSELYIGAYDPSAYDEGHFTKHSGELVTAYLVNDIHSSSTVFEVTDEFGRVRLLKNSKETINISGGSNSLSFQSAPSFMSMINTEATTRDALNEVDATIDHLFYHENTAPFVATRLIQRFVTSNPDPSYVAAVATAFKTGTYDGFGSGKYGDLAATISAVLLEPDAQSHVLDADPFHGSIREPLLKIVSFMRSMELDLLPQNKVLKLDFPLVDKIGQMPHSFPSGESRLRRPIGYHQVFVPHAVQLLIIKSLLSNYFFFESVFSFFLPEHVPPGKPGHATLVSPEAMISDMPKITGMINGLYSTIKFGVSKTLIHFIKIISISSNPNESLFFHVWTYQISPCNSGFGPGDDTNTCQEGDFSKANAVLSFERNNSDAETVVNELSTLLTNGRLSTANKEIIKGAYTSKLPDQAAALRIAQQLIVTSPEFHTTNTIRKSGDTRTLAQNPQPSGVPYKAVVMVMLAGGADSYNMLIPHTCASSDLYAEYTQARQQVAIGPKDALLQIDASSSAQVCETFGLHPKLINAQKMYNEGVSTAIISLCFIFYHTRMDSHNSNLCVCNIFIFETGPSLFRQCWCDDQANG